MCVFVYVCVCVFDVCVCVFVYTVKLPKTKKLVAPFDREKSLGLLLFKKE